MIRGRFLQPRVLQARTRLFSSSSDDKTYLPKKVYSSSLETPDQKAFGKEAYLEEVKGDIPTITGWGIGQFRINSLRISGPIILTPKLVFRWNLPHDEPTVKHLKLEDFELFTILNPALDLIVLGTGKTLRYPEPSLLKALRDIAPVEVLDSVNAGATFNLLSKEDRQVAAALLPIYDWSQ